MDAIEETIFTEPVDEIILSVAPHGLSTMLHQDLAHRLAHFGLPITVVAPAAATT
jgi:D-arabinose 5-phosphate isomerase GutQ